ncbi:MAG TPA: hypothetical protein VFI03_06780 [Solirubrobacterales bacterium]|nr:hypothetical protein [Solirubrobacterales bacterium]
MKITLLSKVLVALLLVSLFGAGVAVAERSIKGGGDAGGSELEAELLFVQDAKGGTLIPAGKGEYWLTLRGVKPRTMWFQDRPGSLKGSVPNGEAMDLIFADRGTGLPNGSVDAWDPRREDDVVMGVQFISGSWSQKQGVLRYKVRRLKELRPTQGRGGTIDKTLPRHFADASVFVDDIWTELDKIVSGHTCGGELQNSTGERLGWATDFKDDTDSWVQMPHRSIPAWVPEPFVDGGRIAGRAFWGTVSGWLRGCYNRVTYVGDRGRVTLGIYDPFRGPNEWACTTTGDYSCEGPLAIGAIGGSQLYGDHLRVWFRVRIKPGA